VAVVFRQSIPNNIRTDRWISVLKDRQGLFSAYRQCLPKAHVKQKRSFTGLLNVQFHHWMDFPHSVVRHVLSTVGLLFRSMVVGLLPRHSATTAERRRISFSTLNKPRSIFAVNLLVHDLDLLIDHPSGEAVDRHMHPVMLLSFDNKPPEICFSRRKFSALRDHVDQ
jgi:hypothetical protein